MKLIVLFISVCSIRVIVHYHNEVYVNLLTSPEHLETINRTDQINKGSLYCVHLIVLLYVIATIKYLHLPTHQYLYHVQLSNQTFCISSLYIPSCTSHTSLTIY